MPATPPPPLFRRVPPEAWVALAWCVAAAYPAVLLGATAQRHQGAALHHGAAVHGGLAFTLADTAVAFLGAALVRRLPVLSVALLLVATWTETDGWSGNAQVPPGSLLAVDVALFLITAARPRRSSRGAFALVMAFLVLHIGLVHGDTVGIFTGTHIGSADGAALLALVAWLAGRSVRQNREHAETLSSRAAAEAVTAERLRIAREMHDTVAHSIGIVALQAGAARRVIDRRPERAKQALGEIESAGRETLAALRRMLVVLREAEGEPSATAPQGLGDLDRLAETTTAAGVRVVVRREGTPGPLPPEIDLSAFRIIQESVTNVVRHAQVRDCRVTVHRTAGELTVEVTDRGRGHGTAPGSGFGLAGLRERVALLHGEFEAGPRPDGGFRVAARLPVPTEVTA
ncbi:sensor histidine kinase [Streptomyces sp. FH025]|uniref:sensor histidine kinase n=1 Tax=Streptomyces sp. FH025 TaxID=2815937 RepID=UPI001A9EF32D|nr:sensor histidine kinase [Streptomyces sp. FH025]MBO1418762.1 sensor histidine kinase [Streptomyces sp. FH025]